MPTELIWCHIGSRLCPHKYLASGKMHIHIELNKLATKTLIDCQNTIRQITISEFKFSVIFKSQWGFQEYILTFFFKALLKFVLLFIYNAKTSCAWIQVNQVERKNTKDIYCNKKTKLIFQEMSKLKKNIFKINFYSLKLRATYVAP